MAENILNLSLLYQFRATLCHVATAIQAYIGKKALRKGELFYLDQVWNFTQLKLV